MEVLRNWGVALCCTAAACGILQFLAPKNGLGRMLELLCGVVLLFSILSPLVTVDWPTVFSAEFPLSNTAQNELLQQELREQIDPALQDAVSKAGMEALASYGLQAQKIDTITDIDQNGVIYIREIRVVLNEKQMVRRSSVVKILKQRFSVEIVVEEE